MEWRDETYFQVGTWWPGHQAYGGLERFTTLRAAKASIEKSRALGYEDGGGEIHLRKVTVRRLPTK